ncbi:MAG: YciI family protein [Acidobacteriota bacterium]
MASYMLLFWAPKQFFAGPPRSPDAARASAERWHSWTETLQNGGHEPTGGQLEPDAACVTQAGVTSGTLAAEHLMGGYVIVKASSLDAAAELARGCPLVAIGGTVEVRPLMA